MKRVGIITLCCNDNYGNKLQNYALKKYIEEFGYSVNTIWSDSSSNTCIVKKIIKLAIKKIKKVNRKKLLDKEHKLRIFSKKYLSNDYRIRLSNNIKKIDNYYDFFIVGSDQVWNYKCMSDYDLYFLNKIDQSKCLTYAPSFGVSDIPSSYYPIYSFGIKKFRNLSVREDRGKELIKKITNRDDVEVLIDPTMLLTSKDWEKIERKPIKSISQKYIVTYFLGKINEKRKKEILMLAQKYKCEIINIMNENDKFYTSSPEEFLFLIHHAEFVLTDSFHACVFSIIYDKTFVIFNREYNGLNMNSRIDTLLSKLRIIDRKYNETNFTDGNLKHDYSKAYKILEIERKKSKEFLEKSFNINDKE